MSHKFYNFKKLKYDIKEDATKEELIHFIRNNRRLNEKLLRYLGETKKRKFRNFRQTAAWYMNYLGIPSHEIDQFLNQAASKRKWGKITKAIGKTAGTHLGIENPRVWVFMAALLVQKKTLPGKNGKDYSGIKLHMDEFVNSFEKTDEQKAL